MLGKGLSVRVDAATAVDTAAQKAATNRNIRQGIMISFIITVF